VTPVPELLLEVVVQVDRLDAQPPAHVVQKLPHDRLPALRGGRSQQGVALLPLLLVLAALLEPLVTDLQEIELLEVGIGEPPTPAEV
jgi:hypothetical protein